MPTSTKATLIQVNAYLASNNIKRNIGSFGVNVPNANGDVKTINTTVLANNGTYPYAGAEGNLVTLVKSDLPLNVDVAFAGGGGFSKIMTSILLLDMEVASILFTNLSPTDNVNLTIISG